MSKLDISHVLDLTADIVSAYVSHNAVEQQDLAGLVETVFNKVHYLSDPVRLHQNRPRPVPAVPVADSVTDAVIFSLEDGQPYKSLKRHLKAKYGMSPEDYREKWDLPSDYPMVSPAYARERSSLAKKSGLGTNQNRSY
ncbi:MAG: MucR family transcriptional regulator [Alphaproteobacteria bacterium]